MKKTIIAIVAATTLFASTTALAASKFTDVPDTYWAAPAINAMVDQGVLKGYSDGTFKPENPVNKGEFAHMFHALYPDASQGSNSATFADTKGHWAAADFSALFIEDDTWITADHFDSKGNAYLAPNKQLTRWDVAMLLGLLTPGLKATANSDGEVIVSTEEILKTISAYSDIKVRPIAAGELPSTAPVILTRDFDGEVTFASDLDNEKAALIYSVIKKGIMTGASGKFRPSAKVTRAEAVTTLQRIDSLK